MLEQRESDLNEVNNSPQQFVIVPPFWLKRSCKDIKRLRDSLLSQPDST